MQLDPQDPGFGAANVIRAQIENARPVTPEKPLALVRHMPRADPFPVKNLGELETVALAIHGLTQAPLAIAAQSVLSAACLCVQGHANIQLPTGQDKPVSLYLTTVAKSGERKSSADDWAMSGVLQYEKHLRSLYDEDLRKHSDSLDVWENERKSIIGKRGVAALEKRVDLEALGSKPEAPRQPTICFSEPTFEGLIKYLATSRPSLGVLSQEGGSFIGGHSMSEDKKLGTAAGLSQFWDGSPIKRLRAGDGASVHTGKRLCFHLMVQPDVAAKLLTDRVLIDQGFNSRILLSAPDSTAGSRKWKEPKEEDKKTVAAFQAKTVELLMTECRHAESSSTELDPRVITMSDDARCLWIEFHDDVEEQAGKEDGTSGIRSLLNKLPEHAARLAAVLALFEDVNVRTLEGRHMFQGKLLAEHYAGEARRMSEAAHVSAPLKKAQALLDWLQNSWSESIVSIPDMCQGTRIAKDKKVAVSLCKILEDYGWLKPLDGSVMVKGQMRKKVYEIVPEDGSQ